jgi:hypothetical protein
VAEAATIAPIDLASIFICMGVFPQVGVEVCGGGEWIDATVAARDR